MLPFHPDKGEPYTSTESQTNYKSRADNLLLKIQYKLQINITIDI